MKASETDAIVEQYVEGRELYVGILGNERLRVFPVWELQLGKMSGATHRIATERVKWNPKYQRKHGIEATLADLPDEQAARIQHICTRAYRILQMNGYARVDLRMDVDGTVYVLEGNPNPQLAFGEDFAEAAERIGLSYSDLIQQVMNVGLRWRPERMG